MLGFKVIIAAALLAQRVLGEGVHLINCWSFGEQTTIPRTYVSIVAYCANDADCSDIHYSIPPNDACIVSSSTTLDDFHTWEGGPQSCTFASTGVTFSWNIPTSAQSQAAYSWVGTGSNGFKSFNGYKDDGYVGATWVGHTCGRRYYFL